MSHYPIDISQQELKKLLFKAVRENSDHYVSSAITRGVNINITEDDNKKQNALHVLASIAADAKDSGIKNAELLIRKGINIDAKDNNGQTALYIAIKNKVFKLIKFLIEKGAQVIYSKNDLLLQLLQLAFNNKYANEVIEILVDEYIKINEPGKRNLVLLALLLLAAKYGYLEMAELLIKNGVNINGVINGISALQLAVKHGRNKIVELLINTNNNNYSEAKNINNTVDNEGNTPLHIAVLSNNEEMFKLLTNIPMNGKVDEILLGLEQIMTQENNSKQSVKDIINDKIKESLSDMTKKTKYKGIISLFKKLDADIRKVQDKLDHERRKKFKNAKPQVEQNMESSQIDDAEICPICRDNLDGDIKTLSCNHTFHKDCIQGSYSFSSTNCPICRKEINENEIKKKYLKYKRKYLLLKNKLNI